MDQKADAVEILPGGDWMSAKWRPAMGWVYMAICLCDFIIFPIAWSLLQVYYHGNVNDQWDPITLQGAGLIHMAFGAILGIAAWSRGQEKITAMTQGYEAVTPTADYRAHSQYPQPNQYPPQVRVPPKVPVPPIQRPPYTD